MSPKILVVAENVQSLASLQRAVSKVGGKLFGSTPTLLATCDGREALHLVFSDGALDLVLLDLRLQGMTGLEAARQMRTRFSPADLPIVGLVPQGSNSGLESADKLFNDVLQKPLSGLALNKLMKKHARCFQTVAGVAPSPQHGAHPANVSAVSGYPSASGSVPSSSATECATASEVSPSPTQSSGSVTSGFSMNPGVERACSIHILIAEDSMANQMVIKRAVRKITRSIWGVEPVIEAVTDGAQAVTAAMNNRYDIVLMDIYMPVMSGILATRDIRKRYSMAELPIIALTAADDGELEKMENSGFNEVASKNMSNDMLFALLERYIRKPRPGIDMFSESVLAASMGHISLHKPGP